jgi:hypothetical protein
MSSHIAFKSVFAPYFNSFLEMKRTMGFGTEHIKCFFNELDQFFTETSVTKAFITKEQISV